MPRKHLVASATNKKQQQNAAQWQKLAREIRAAAKVGGTSPDANPRLRLAIQRALDNNLSKESIEKNIGANKSEADLQEMDFEAFAMHGVAIVMHVLSDNVNRVAGNIRGYLSKLDTTLAKPGAAKILFEQKGVVAVEKGAVSEEDLLTALENQRVDDLKEEDDQLLVLCPPEQLENVRQAVSNKTKVIDAQIKLLPLTTVSLIEQKDWDLLDAFIARCDEDEDIAWVVTNAA